MSVCGTLFAQVQHLLLGQQINPQQFVQAQPAPQALQPAPRPNADFAALRPEFTEQNNRLERLSNELEQEYTRIQESHKASKRAYSIGMPCLITGAVLGVFSLVGFASSKLWLLRFGALGALALVGVAAYMAVQDFKHRAEVKRRVQNMSDRRTQTRGLMSDIAQSRLRYRLDPQDPRLWERWPVNTQVFTSHLQDTVEWQDNRLISRLDNLLGRHHTLRSACEELQRTGHTTSENNGLREQPLISTNHVAGWDQRQQRPRRGLIIIGQYRADRPNEEAHRLEARDRIQRMLTRRFGMQQGDIQVLFQPTQAQIEQALRGMHAFADNHENAEAFVALLGHGPTPVVNIDDVPEDEAFCRQGGLQGRFDLNHNDHLWERNLKQMFNRHLTNFSSTFLMVNCCYSGAWGA